MTFTAAPMLRQHLRGRLFVEVMDICQQPALRKGKATVAALYLVSILVSTLEGYILDIYGAQGYQRLGVNFGGRANR